MEIESEHNGIKFGGKCWAWDFNESDGSECFFLGHVKGLAYPVKVIDEDGHNNGFKNARPLKTESEKVLEAFEDQKIFRKQWIGKDHYYIPNSIDSDDRLQCLRKDGATINFHVISFEDWQLWEAPKVKLDTRRVAGWWCTWAEIEQMHCVREVSKDGLSLAISTRCYASELRENAVFSKDPMKPLDEWQTLEEICRQAQA